MFYIYIFSFIILLVSIVIFFSKKSELKASKDEPKVIVINGIIASGKTTFIDKFNKYLNNAGLKVATIDEPIEKWMKTNIFQTYCADPKKYAFSFQVQAFCDRINLTNDIYDEHGNNVHIYIHDRHPSSDVIFMESQHKLGNIDDVMLESYRTWCDTWFKHLKRSPDLFIFLKPSLEETMNRLKKRGREGEEGITDKYQQLLMDEHDSKFGGENVTITFGNSTKYVKSITVDNEKCDDEEIFKRIIKILF